jgi:hypothetical protein
MRLKATITPEMCPYLDQTIEVKNKRTIKIRGGTITFYVTPNLVVGVKREVPPAKWGTMVRSTYETQVFELRVLAQEVYDEDELA